MWKKILSLPLVTLALACAPLSAEPAVPPPPVSVAIVAREAIAPTPRTQQHELGLTLELANPAAAPAQFDCLEARFFIAGELVCRSGYLWSMAYDKDVGGVMGLHFLPADPTDLSGAKGDRSFLLPTKGKLLVEIQSAGCDFGRAGTKTRRVELTFFRGGKVWATATLPILE